MLTMTCDGCGRSGAKGSYREAPGAERFDRFQAYIEIEGEHDGRDWRADFCSFACMAEYALRMAAEGATP